MSSDSRLTDPMLFAAPRGRRVRWIAKLSIAVMVIVCGVNGVVAQQTHLHGKAFWWVVIAPLSGMAVVVPIMLWARIHGYRLTPDELQVLRPGRIDRYPLSGLIDAGADRHALENAGKIWGNDGLGAITGRFQSTRLGKFEALVSDPEHAVVLRWPDRCLVVSPEPAEAFAAAVRARIKPRR